MKLEDMKLRGKRYKGMKEGMKGKKYKGTKVGMKDIHFHACKNIQGTRVKISRVRG